ncbi:hypothetical protein GO013_16610, partial [Pseudodesulfovibrio sp. JC047]|nr:hypothetical protein [Pseudodesulfovibrio sp. JC047]
GMTFGELVELGEVSCTLSDGNDNPIAVMAVVKGNELCTEVLEVIARHEEDEDEN